MLRLLQYYGRFQGVKGSLGQMPAWGRFLLTLAALPGIALILLSILAFGVSLLALLVLTVPVYRLVQALSGGRRTEPSIPETILEPSLSPGRRHVEVTIIE